MEALVHRPRLTTPVMWTVLISVVLACTPPQATPSLPGNPYLPKAALEAEDAYRIQMPASERIRTTGSERFNNITGPEPAFAGAIWGSGEDLSAIYLYYYRELARLGWREIPDPILVDVEISAKGWCKPDMHFRLGFFDPDNYADVGIENGQRFKTVFQAVLSGSVKPCADD